MFFNKHEKKRQPIEAYLYTADRERLISLVCKMSQMTNASLRDIAQAVLTNNLKLADSVIYGDDAIDISEEEIDQECLYSIATRQPLHADLRFVYAVMKIVTDIERIGDQCVSMARLLYQLHDFGETRSEEVSAEIIKYVDEASDIFNALTGILSADEERVINETSERLKTLKTEIGTDVRNMLKDSFCADGSCRNCGVITVGVLLLMHIMRVVDHLMNFAEKLNFIATGISPMNYKRGLRKKRRRRNSLPRQIYVCRI